MKQLYVVRHCQAEGQEPEAALTPEGKLQAEALRRFFRGIPIERIVSSPFVRAESTILPLAKERGLPVQLDDRLKERVLSTEHMPDWYERLRDTFDDLDLVYPGGESSRMAINRAASAVFDALGEKAVSTVIVTHGALMTLLLKQFDDRFGFEQWRQLSNPDVFLVTLLDQKHEVKRIWT